MKRIGIFLDTAGNHGGVHQYSMAMVHALQELPKDEFEIICICATEEWLTYCKERKFAYYYTDKIVNKSNAIQFLLSFAKAFIFRQDILECREKSIDYVIFPSVAPSMLFVKKPICAIHDLMHRYAKGFPEMNSVYQYVLRDILFRLIAKRSVAVFTDSMVGKKHVEESYLHNRVDDRVKVLPFIAPDYIYSSENMKEDENWRKMECELPPHFFFYPAQFWKHKNHITIVKAFSKLSKKYPDMHLVFAGSRKNASDIVQTYIEENGLASKIHVLGYVSNYSMVQLYKKATALIMASCAGPTNIPQLEAFYLGCPVIVADIFAVHEQVKDAALLFQPEDADTLALHMEKIWNDAAFRNMMIEKGHAQSVAWGPKQFNGLVRTILESIVRE